jgi:predicted nucleic acid-binding protein
LPKKLVVDSSTLIALERAGLIKFLNRINYAIIIPPSIKEEVNSERILKFCEVQELNGRTLKLSKNIEHLGIGKGESQCCALAIKLKSKFIVCDDRKFIRQRFFSGNKKVQNIKILGFSFFLHLFYKKKLIKDIWGHFGRIIKLNNWERSEVQIANYTFLKEMGY